MNPCNGASNAPCSCKAPAQAPLQIKTIIIDEGGCIGCGLCRLLCPEVFQVRAGGVARLREDLDLDGIPIEAIQDVVELCPVLVVHLELEDG